MSSFVDKLNRIKVISPIEVDNGVVNLPNIDRNKVECTNSIATKIHKKDINDNGIESLFVNNKILKLVSNDNVDDFDYIMKKFNEFLDSGDLKNRVIEIKEDKDDKDIRKYIMSNIYDCAYEIESEDITIMSNYKMLCFLNNNKDYGDFNSKNKMIINNDLNDKIVIFKNSLDIQSNSDSIFLYLYNRELTKSLLYKNDDNNDKIYVIDIKRIDIDQIITPLKSIDEMERDIDNEILKNLLDTNNDEEELDHCINKSEIKLFDISNISENHEKIDILRDSTSTDRLSILKRINDYIDLKINVFNSNFEKMVVSSRMGLFFMEQMCINNIPTNSPLNNSVRYKLCEYKSKDIYVDPTMIWDQLSVLFMNNRDVIFQLDIDDIENNLL